jgi:hypothetical protein
MYVSNSGRFAAIALCMCVAAAAAAPRAVAATHGRVPATVTPAGEYPRPRLAVPHATSCTGTGQNAFVGKGESNVAAGQDSGFLTGNGNSACDYESGVGTGYNNIVSSASSSTANPSFIAGGYDNSISGIESFIGAGSTNSNAGFDSGITSGENNTLNVPFTSIVGGEGNAVNGSWDTFIGGGNNNLIRAVNGSTTEQNGAFYATIGGGLGNRIAAVAANGAEYGTIAGGSTNSLTGMAATVGGGTKNFASGTNATVPGGNGNTAQGIASFAAGNLAYARYNGSFVWGDDSGTATLTATAANQFLVRASGGVMLFSNAGATTGVSLPAGSGSWSSLSDRAQKRDIATIDDAAILDKVGSLPVSEWSYSAEGRVRHLGPMAQDFYSAFGVGEDPRHIATIDEEGVALAAIKALRARDAERARDLATLRAQLHRRDSDVAALQREVAELAARLPARNR